MEVDGWSTTGLGGRTYSQSGAWMSACGRRGVSAQPNSCMDINSENTTGFNNTNSNDNPDGNSNENSNATILDKYAMTINPDPKYIILPHDIIFVISSEFNIAKRVLPFLNSYNRASDGIYSTSADQSFKNGNGHCSVGFRAKASPSTDSFEILGSDHFSIDDESRGM